MTLVAQKPSKETPSLLPEHGSERRYLLDVIREVQAKFGCFPQKAIELIAADMGIHRVEVEGVVSFYHFLSWTPSGQTRITLTRGATPSINGLADVAKAFEKELGIGFGEVTLDGAFGLDWTSCIGMCDQEPAALIGSIPFTKLDPDKVRVIVEQLKLGSKPQDLVATLGDGNNASEPIQSMVQNNIRRTGPVVFADYKPGAAIRRLVGMTQQEVIAEIKKSNLRGRGGAGFPTGLKWEFCAKAPGGSRYVICNADEGEPGTFKDRVILTELPKLIFEGMIVAAHAIGSREGILYLRAEYEYLRAHLELALKQMREAGLLGVNICGKDGFNFDIRIQMGAGAYICGEETALIESAEGKRGDPRDRPPYPVSNGYLGKPTAVNNVETLCDAARIVEKGAAWFNGIGTERSSGTKILSISGDVEHPGIYEFPFGMTISDILVEAGGTSAHAVQIGGPSGACVPPQEFGRKIAFEDIPTGGAFIVIGPDRDLLTIVRDFMDFFKSESCGRCSPCRVGNNLMLRALDKILSGRGTKSDLEYLKSLGRTIKFMSRCGLGQTATNSVLNTLASFPHIYENRLSGEDFVSEHDMDKALEEGRRASGRTR